MPDRRVDRLNRPAGNNLSDIGQLKIGLIVARWREQSGEIDLVLIEAAYALTMPANTIPLVRRARRN